MCSMAPCVRVMRVGLWLNDKNAVIGLSRLNPLPKNSAVNNSLAKGLEEKAKPMPGVAPPRRTPLFHSETFVGNSFQ